MKIELSPAPAGGRSGRLMILPVIIVRRLRRQHIRRDRHQQLPQAGQPPRSLDAGPTDRTHVSLASWSTGNQFASKVRFAPDSSLEEDGFEPSIPLKKRVALFRLSGDASGRKRAEPQRALGAPIPRSQPGDKGHNGAHRGRGTEGSNASPSSGESRKPIGSFPQTASKPWWRVAGGPLLDA